MTVRQQQYEDLKACFKSPEKYMKQELPRLKSMAAGIRLVDVFLK